MATVLLLRHGRTTANATGELAGRLPVELDETGRRQAERAGERLRALPLAEVVTSPLIRCRTTVELALPGRTAVVDEGFTECGYGDWEGRPLKELAKEDLWPVVQQHPSAAVFPNGEAMAAMSARAVSAVRRWDAKVTAEHGPEALWAVCSHGDVIKAIIADALGLHLDQFQRIVADPASVSVIRYTPTRPFIVRVNDTSDLSSLVPQAAVASDAAVGGGAGSGQ
ncbi:histidine phosphatase family protein [Paractinoplanes atraurantiacus]|uniref:Probable phosphomutase, MSMEG_4193 family n=1 Tax=Paractinoplanes atraurantiacus TaxID=1036182 RepID=A0A285I2A2_9ACTN|nr:histidine phosphatase family protein [Actinoplanes atraurantiacus]SNY42079.1 probable phosphomutase, MSMEG_4193 family [Actinoplanes atraurantiacus]